MGMHGLTKQDTDDMLCVFYARMWCLLHQLALMVKSQLELLGQHFSNVAKFIHIWRSPHLSKKIYDSWRRLRGPDRAKAVCGRLPPKPLKGQGVFKTQASGDSRNCRRFVDGSANRASDSCKKRCRLLFLLVWAPLCPLGSNVPINNTGVCEIKTAGPCTFIGFGAMGATKPYTSIWFGDIDGPKLYEFIGSGGLYFVNICIVRQQNRGGKVVGTIRSMELPRD